jgi:hypothetical protein
MAFISQISSLNIATYMEAGVIGTAYIGTASITTAKIQDGQITTAKIGDAQITTAKIGDAQITTAKIGTAQITTAKIGDAQITTAKITDLAVQTLKIADQAVTFPRGIFTSGEIIFYDATIVQSLTMTPTGAPVSITASLSSRNQIPFNAEVGTPAYVWNMQIRRVNGGSYTYFLGGSPIASYRGTAESSTQPGRETINGFGLSSATVIDATPPAGVSCTYEVIVFCSIDNILTSAPIGVSGRALQLLELKK